MDTSSIVFVIKYTYIVFSCRLEFFWGNQQKRFDNSFPVFLSSGMGDSDLYSEITMYKKLQEEVLMFPIIDICSLSLF